MPNGRARERVVENDLVDAGLEVGDEIGTRVPAEAEVVGAGAAGQHIEPKAAFERITARTAGEHVKAGAAHEQVVSGAAVEHHAAVVREQAVAEARADDLVDAAEGVALRIAKDAGVGGKVDIDGLERRRVARGVEAFAADQRIGAACRR